KAEVARKMRLIVTGKLRESARHIRPFGKSAAPGGLVLRDDVKLREIISNELYLRTGRIEIEESAFGSVFGGPIVALAALEQLAIFFRDQAVRVGCRVTHRKSVRCLSMAPLGTREHEPDRLYQSVQSRMATKDGSEPPCSAP